MSAPKRKAPAEQLQSDEAVRNFALILKPPEIEALTEELSDAARVLAVCRRLGLVMYFCCTRAITFKFTCMADVARLLTEELDGVTDRHESVHVSLGAIFTRTAQCLQAAVEQGANCLASLSQHTEVLLKSTQIVLYSTLSAPLSATVVDLYGLWDKNGNGAAAKVYLPRVSHVVLNETYDGDVSRCLILAAKTGLASFTKAMPLLAAMEEAHGFVGTRPVRIVHVIASLKIKMRSFLDGVALDLGGRVGMSEIAVMGLSALDFKYGLTEMTADGMPVE